MANDANLLPSHPGNTSAVKHGVYAAHNRVLAPRAREVAEARAQKVPHVRLGKYVRFDEHDLAAWIETVKRRPK